MKLCLAFGEPNPDRLLEALTYKQFLEWIAYYQIDPWGEERADIRSAMQSMTTANCAPFSGRKESFKLDDFMIKFDAEPEKQPEPSQGLSPDQLLAKAKAITAAMKRKVPK